MRRLDGGVPKTAQVTVAQVIRKDDDEIGGPGFLAGYRLDRQDEQGKEQGKILHIT